MSVKNEIKVKFEKAGTKEEKSRLYQDLYIAELWEKLPRAGKDVVIQEHVHLPLIKKLVEQQFKYEGLLLDIPNGCVDENRFNYMIDLLSNPAKTIHPAFDPCFAITWQRLTVSRLVLLQGKVTPLQESNVNEATHRLECLADGFLQWTKNPSTLLAVEKWASYANSVVKDCENVINCNGAFTKSIAYTSVASPLDLSQYNVKRVFAMFTGDTWKCSFDETLRGAMDRARRELLNAVHEVNIQFMQDLKRF
jgi:hypothetical protein